MQLKTCPNKAIVCSDCAYCIDRILCFPESSFSLNYITEIFYGILLKLNYSLEVMAGAHAVCVKRIGNITRKIECIILERSPGHPIKFIHYVKFIEKIYFVEVFWDDELSVFYALISSSYCLVICVTNFFTQGIWHIGYIEIEQCSDRSAWDHFEEFVK